MELAIAMPDVGPPPSALPENLLSDYAPPVLDGSAPSANLRSPRVRLGASIPGGWTLDAVLGIGGTATVYRATRSDGSAGAVKVLHAELALARDWSRRLRREAELLASLSHPGLVRLLDMGVLDDGIPFLVMDLLEGASVDVLRERAPSKTLPAPLALEYGAAILGVLEHTHAVGILHRDLKPSNVFVTLDGRVKVLDFGLASAAASSTSEADAHSVTRGILGTPAYMAPEQARGRWDLVDARTDLWAVGALLFTLLTGESVHVAQTDNERLGLAMTRRARSIGSVAPGLDPAVVRVIDRALAYEPERRFQSAGELRAALSDAVTRTPDERPDRLAEPTLTSPVLDDLEVPLGAGASRRRFGAPLVAGGVLLAAAGLVVTWLLARAPRPPEPPTLAVLPRAPSSSRLVSADRSAHSSAPNATAARSSQDEGESAARTHPSSAPPPTATPRKAAAASPAGRPRATSTAERPDRPATLAGDSSERPGDGLPRASPSDVWERRGSGKSEAVVRGDLLDRRE